MADALRFNRTWLRQGKVEILEAKVVPRIAVYLERLLCSEGWSWKPKTLTNGISLSCQGIIFRFQFSFVFDYFHFYDSLMRALLSQRGKFLSGILCFPIPTTHHVISIQLKKSFQRCFVLWVFLVFPSSALPAMICEWKIQSCQTILTSVRLRFNESFSLINGGVSFRLFRNRRNLHKRRLCWWRNLPMTHAGWTFLISELLIVAFNYAIRREATEEQTNRKVIKNDNGNSWQEMLCNLISRD